MNASRKNRRAHWAAYLWPGLPHLWIGGSLAGLVLALGFAVLLNILILAVFVWPGWLAPSAKVSCGVMVGLVWVAALIETRGELRRLALQKERESEQNQTGLASVPPEMRKADALLQLAQRSYLSADWLQAERLLRSLLKIEKDDVEGHLLLAGVHRRLGRPADARRRLQRLSTREGAERWRMEINRELEWLVRAVKPEKTEEPPRQAA